MRALVLSDIHSNLEAFNAALDDASARGAIDEYWCLGDTVGYGPNPVECMEMVRGFSSHIWVVGNHDLAAAGKLSTEEFNHEAAFATHWTVEQLTSEQAVFCPICPK